MESKLYKLEEVIEFIKQDKLLALAGDDKVLSKLPKGNWIGGTIPYFMGKQKGVFSQDLIFVNDLSNKVENFKIKSYNKSQIENIVSDSYKNGFTIVIIPPFTDVNKEYAIQMPNNQNLFKNPITGWVSGVDLNSNDIAKTYNGQTGEIYTDEIVAIHAELPENKVARIDTLNIFHQSEDEIEIEFLDEGFTCTRCLINGKETNFSQYIKENKIDIKLPIISDYSGALINVGIHNIDGDSVKFYAPVFKNRKYKFAKPVPNYVDSFNSHINKLSLQPTFSCNCILNFMYGKLEGKKIKNVTGPITFGEVGYLLLNQTLVFLYIEDK